MNSAVLVMREVVYVSAYICRIMELSIIIFFTTQYFKAKSTYKSAYYVILNIGYLEDFIVFLNAIVPINSELFSFTNIIHIWHNTYFMVIWNAVLCMNRCTALTFPLKHDKVSSFLLKIFACKNFCFLAAKLYFHCITISLGYF